MKDLIQNCKALNPEWGYKRIAAAVGCSPNLVKYHLNPGEKEKYRLRWRDQLTRLNGILKRKKDNFQCVSPSRRRSQGAYCSRNRHPSTFTPSDLRDKLGDSPVCYLTGRRIDLLAPATYNLDHILPVVLGGGNSIDNCGLTCKEANMAKSALTIAGFLSLCKEVLEHNGYSVTKLADG